MGQQTSSNTLNCKTSSQDKQSQITATKQTALKIIKRQGKKQKAQQNQQKSVTKVSPVRLLSPRNQSQTSITSNTTNSKTFIKKQQKSNIKIPDHQAVIKVSLSPFPNSLHSVLKENPSPYYIQTRIKTLGQIIESRYRTTKHLPYSQILLLLQSLVNGCAYFAKKSISFHDYYPTNIFYCNGKFKIQNPVLSKCSGFSLTVQRKRFSFLSPQLIISLLQEISQQQIGQYTLYKADVFSIGMILLETCSLEPSSQCYDEQNYNIIDSIIKNRIQKISKVYTPQFAQCVNLMLQYQVQYRLDPILLAQIIHTKIQQQKNIAHEMQNQHLRKQNNQFQKGPIVLPQQQNMMMPIQKPIPYNHQPFKLQNLNSNSIAVTLPNQVYSRIGPNNQGFLSASTLQNKLRVIELIHQNPKQEQEEQQEQKYKHKSKQNLPSIQNQNQNVQNSELLASSEYNTKYPFVESVYSKQITENKYSQNRSQQFTESTSQNKKHIINQNMDQRFVDVKIKPQISIKTNYQSNIQRMPFYPISPKNSLQNQTPVNYPLISKKYENLPPQKDIQHQYILNREFSPPQMIYKQGLVTSAPTLNSYKYGTSYEISNGNIEGQTLQARVQRVLKMSRNVK